MTTKALLSEFKTRLTANNLNGAIELAHSLGKSTDKKGVPVLLTLLRGKYPSDLKNAAAVALRDLAANEAVPILLNLIKNRAHHINRGTFVYALETLDWFSQEGHVKSVVSLLFDKNAEVREEAKAVIRSALTRANQTQGNKIWSRVVAAKWAHESPLQARQATSDAFSVLINPPELVSSTS